MGPTVITAPDTPANATEQSEFRWPFALVDDRTVLASVRMQGPRLLRVDGPVKLPKGFEAKAIVAPGLVACEVTSARRPSFHEWETKPIELAIVDADGREQRKHRYLVPRYADLLGLLADGSLIANIIDDHDNARVVAFRSGTPKPVWTIALAPGTGLHSQSMALSPDRSQLVSAHENQLYRFETGSRTVERIAKSRTSSTGVFRPVAFSPDGMWLVDSGADKSVQVWDTRTWKVKHTAAVEHDVTHAVFAGGSVLLSDLGRLSVMDASDWARPPEEIVLVPWAHDAILAASPSSRSILVGSFQELHIWTLDELLARPRRKPSRAKREVKTKRRTTFSRKELDAMEGFARGEWGPGSRTALAIDLEGRGDFEASRDAYLDSIKYELGGTGSELGLLRVLDRLGDVTGVLALADRLEDRGVQSVGLYTARARAWLDAGSPREAKKAAERAVKLDRKAAYAWYLLGCASQALDDLPSAIKSAKQCTELEPKWAPGWHLLGSCHHHAEDKVPALEAFGRAVKLDPSYASATVGDEGPALSELLRSARGTSRAVEKRQRRRGRSPVT